MSLSIAEHEAQQPADARGGATELLKRENKERVAGLLQRLVMRQTSDSRMTQRRAAAMPVLTHA
jgi:hypothetical protein